MADYEQALQSVRDIFINYPKQLELHEEALRKVEQEIQDILHAIEMANFNACDGYRLAKDLQKARKDRRKLKDEIDLLTCMKEFTSYQRPTEKIINKTMGDVRGIQQRQAVRVYKMRVRDDLQELVK